MTAQAPGRVPLRIVQLAARALPPVHRDRYEGEFIAELHGMARYRQMGHATQVLTHAWALRAALGSAPATIGEEAMTRARDIPLSCRLNLRHKWHIVSTEDGDRYWTCKTCGKEKPTRGAPAGPPSSFN
jgi:hypothetical protein